MIAFEPTDILFRRGPTYYNHPGNKIFPQIIKSYTIYYQNDIPKPRKRACINMVWEAHVSVGCRFLLRNSGADSCWLVASDEIARKKICHSLRDSRSQIFDRCHVQEKGVTMKCNVTNAQNNNKKLRDPPNRRIKISSDNDIQKSHFSQQFVQAMQGQYYDSNWTSNYFMRSVSIEGMN